VGCPGVVMWGENRGRILHGSGFFEGGGGRSEMLSVLQLEPHALIGGGTGVLGSGLGRCGDGDGKVLIGRWHGWGRRGLLRGKLACLICCAGWSARI
jgi:hypothetical protein